jgi:hypothetical protein
VARGKKPVDARLISDIDLMTMRQQIQAVANGAPSVLNIMQFSRLNEGIIAQYREQIPVKKRAEIDKSVAIIMEHAISITCILKGEQLTLLRMHEKDFVKTDNGNRHLAEIYFVEQHYLKIAANQTLSMFEIIANSISGTQKIGRPSGSFNANNEQDWLLIIAALERLTPDRNNHESHIEEIRHVVAEAVKSGQLDIRGETQKGSIDTHAKRLQAKASRLLGSTTF